MPVLGLDELAEGLDRRLRLLTTSAGGDDRHRSLRDAIAWSFRPLTELDQDLLCQVSVFASWFDVDPASTMPTSATGWPGWPTSTCWSWRLAR